VSLLGFWKREQARGWTLFFKIYVFFHFEKSPTLPNFFEKSGGVICEQTRKYNIQTEENFKIKLRFAKKKGEVIWKRGEIGTDLL
jgi:hypothetical protein